jgi:hypothetical protein
MHIWTRMCCAVLLFVLCRVFPPSPCHWRTIKPHKHSTMQHPQKWL